MRKIIVSVIAALFLNIAGNECPGGLGISSHSAHAEPREQQQQVKSFGPHCGNERIQEAASNPQEEFTFPPGTSIIEGAQLQKIQFTRISQTRTAPGVYWLAGNGFAMVNGGSSAYFWNSSTPPVIEVELPSAEIEESPKCLQAFRGKLSSDTILKLEGAGRFVGAQVRGQFVGAFKLTRLISCKVEAPESKKLE